MHAQRKARIVAVGVAVSLTMALAACNGSGTDKAGGEDRLAPVVLTFATNQAFLPDQLGTYPQEVERLSGGTLRIDVKVAWRWDEPTQETGLIADVQAGKIDMAWIGARAFDSVGLKSFEALVAPFLVDSYDLEGRVFDAGIPGRMLEGLDTIGLAGIGVLPGPLRKMTGTSHPFANPRDFADQVVGTSGGALAEQTFRALGATPRLIATDRKLDGLDGFDYQLEAVPQDAAASVVANLNLWPRPLVVVMNVDRFNGLNSEQQQILRRAVADAVKPALEATRADEAHAGSGLCIVGMNVVTATASDFAALRHAVQPVYASLEQDPETYAFLREIRSLKAHSPAEPESFGCSPEPTADRSEVTPFDGVYEVTISAEDLRHAGDPNPIPANFGAYTYVFDRGRFAFTQQSDAICTWQYGTYVVDGDRVEWTFLDGGATPDGNGHNNPGEFFVFGWSLYRDTLTLTAVPGETSPAPTLVKPWHRLDATPSASFLNPDCPPPPEALPS
jgi:TRAP-type C4-dicarboxylate transport system substrate-binding protein